MVLTLVLASLTTALLVMTWTWEGGLFVPLLKRMGRYASDPAHPRVLRMMAFGSGCQYCVSHWIGAAVSLWMATDLKTAAMMVAPVIFLANVAILLFQVIAEARTALQRGPR